MLYQMFKDSINGVYLLFLKPLLTETQQVNKAFQSNSADARLLQKDPTLLIQRLAKKKVTLPGCRANLLKDNIHDFLDLKPYLGLHCRKETGRFKKIQEYAQLRLKLLSGKDVLIEPTIATPAHKH